MSLSLCCNADVQISHSPLQIAPELQALFCSSCQLTLGILNEDAVQETEEFLTDVHIPLGDHWKKIACTKHPAVHYVLSQLIYRPDTTRGEVPYALPDPGDIVKLLWCDRKALGFYTVKSNGPRNETSSIFEELGMPTLDTAFISPSHRRRGFGLSMLEDFVSNYPNMDLGFSQPISKSMWKVLKKFLDVNESLRRKFWLIKGNCDEGNKTLIWFCLKRNHWKDERADQGNRR
ncbi:soluble lamin-associated protein of 75 kDa-like [Macrosteles quadrilineatus]|uniref:soluble lamin-associated protein of 75 kDa-like n=1 Tax=Macrosteles quadrilineatus TaxID=74068 RepID=UPI0023E14D83|nr:soluble lamin-associated protein of 75 kDa-like [Macrosteles quadrilineatus]